MAEQADKVLKAWQQVYLVLRESALPTETLHRWRHGQTSLGHGLPAIRPPDMESAQAMLLYTVDQGPEIRIQQVRISRPWQLGSIQAKPSQLISRSTEHCSL